jgi:catechol 2,3-dioxygenase-like lactoylglutathione lyase family enzyme
VETAASADPAETRGQENRGRREKARITIARCMKLTAVALAGLSISATLFAADSPATSPAALKAPARPRIVGLSHAAFYVNDLAKARAFYKDFLGFAEPFSRPRKNGEVVWIKINDHQTVELFYDPEIARDADRLYHIAVETDDTEAMRAYLQSKGVEVPAATAVDQIGNRNFFIKDPNGNTVEIVQYTPEGWTLREKGKFLPETRISTRLRHVGVLVGQLEASQKFYGEILGFQETWRGSTGGKLLSWVNMKVPDGEDYVEFMLYDRLPTVEMLLTKHHICLEVADAIKTGELLKSRPLPPGCKPGSEPRAGLNGKRQINYYDPDGTRVEIMEPTTADGKPVPSSTAPPPPPLVRP